MHAGFNNRARFIGFYRGDGEAKLARISRRRRRSLIFTHPQRNIMIHALVRVIIAFFLITETLLLARLHLLGCRLY